MPSHTRTPTGLHNGGLVAGTDGEHLEHSAGGPQQLLVVVVPHDEDQPLWAPIGQDDKLTRGNSRKK